VAFTEQGGAGETGHSGDLYQDLESIARRVRDMGAVSSRERGKFVCLKSVFAHDVLNGDAARPQSVSY
jgi:hypothetical protein